MESVSQVKKYMHVIKSNSRFNAGNVKWTFYLVGNDFDTSHYIEGELESHINYGEAHLIHNQDKGLDEAVTEVIDNSAKLSEAVIQKKKSGT